MNAVVKPARSPVSFRAKSENRKLSPIDYEYGRGGRVTKIIPRAPYVSSTYVSIDATCPSSCVFKTAGCYVRAGITGPMSRKLDEAAAELPQRDRGLQVAKLEARAIDRAFIGRGYNRRPRALGRVPQDGARGGRDLRLHIGGETANTAAARVLAAAATRWRARGGGSVWAYTHNWRKIPRAAWGDISVLASVESLDDAAEAWSRGYAAALTTADIGQERAFDVLGGAFRVIPCPAETRDGVTCVTCRLCMDDRALHDRSAIIGFRLHGVQAGAVEHKLVTLRPKQQKLNYEQETAP